MPVKPIHRDPLKALTFYLLVAQLLLVALGVLVVLVKFAP